MPGKHEKFSAVLSALFRHLKGVKLTTIATLGRLVTGMTLAVILCICVFPSASASSGAARIWMQAAGQESPPAQSPDSRAEPSQSNSSSAQNPSASGAQTTTPPAAATPSAVQSPAATKTPSDQSAKGKHRRRKKNSKAENASDCAKSNSAAGNASAPEPAAGQDATAASKAPPTKCPPAKIVVHDGSTTEPAIQLVGGTGAQNAAGQRSTTDQLVGSTEENLKKIAGRQLDSNQQEMLKQIQQFLDQSKAAVAAGDIERGHNLATKAHLLSDELAKP
jgi:hypothetical protein